MPVPRASAASLKDAFLNANIAAEPGGGQVIAPAIEAIQRSAARGTDFPATATTPGFTYSYNPDLNLYERSSTSLGPAFLERAETLGSGRADFGVAYLYANFVELDGHDLETQRSRPFFIRNQGGFVLPESASFPKLSLVSHAIYFSGSYGITDRWDVNLLVPLFDTQLKVRENLTTVNGDRFLLQINKNAVGVGDLQLRTKYRLLEEGSLRVAAGLTTIFPSGSDGDFQGLGDYRVIPSVVASYAVGKFDLHGSTGLELNASEVSRSRIRYGVGGSYGILPRLTGLIDVIGHSGFEDERFNVGTVPATGDPGSLRGIQNTEVNGSNIFAVSKRNDIVDLSVGLKANPFGNLIVFGSAIVPLTHQGIRADVIPAVGMNYNF